MTIKERVWGVIQMHTKKNPVKTKEIAEAVGTNVREVREAVRELVLEGKPIGSRTTPAGYYVITEPEELREAYAKLMKRGLAILERAKALKDKHPELLKPIQLELV